MKLKSSIKILLPIAILIVFIGNLIPLICHEREYYIDSGNFFTVVDINEKVLQLNKGFNLQTSNLVSTYQAFNSDFPTNLLDLPVRRLSVVDVKEDSYHKDLLMYKIDVYTFFNLKFSEDYISEKYIGE